MNDTEIRYLKWRLQQANKTMGKQGTTIANLRGELARVREEHSKIERGELRRLENFEFSALGHYRDYQDEADHAQREIAQLREKLTAEGHICRCSVCGCDSCESVGQ